MRLIRIGVALAAAAFCVGVSATERLEVCAKEGNGKAYRVEATVASGQDLNVATHTFSFSTYAKYVVIFWTPHEASIIELSSPYLNAFDVDGRDQQGRAWKVSTNVTYCL